MITNNLYVQHCDAGDGVVDEEEFEFTLSDGFDISPNDCRIAFRIFTQVSDAARH